MPSTTSTTENNNKSISDEHDDIFLDEEPGSAEGRQKKRVKPFLYVVAMCAALGGLIFGYDIGGAGGTFIMPFFQEHFGWDIATTEKINRDQGLINGLFGIGATVGAMISPRFADRFGRKSCLFVACCMFLFGATLQVMAPNMDMMLVGRVFSGYGIGGLSMCVPVYISELSPEHIRGKLGTLWQMAIVFGILLVSAMNIGLTNISWGWRVSYGGNILFAIILVVSLSFMPESPRWLTGNGHTDQAQAAMHKVRYEDEIHDEMKTLQAECLEEQKLGVATWGQVFEKENTMRYRLVLGIMLQVSQQLCGINGIMFYAPVILSKFFSNEASIFGAFLLNLINFLSTFITIFTADRAGRVWLLFTGGVMMTLSLIATAICAYFDATTTIGYFIIFFSATFIVGFAYSWGPLVWVVCAELFPIRQRGKATGLTTASNWICTTLIGASVPAFATLSLTAMFSFFATTMCLGTIMVYFFQAETANKTVLEIDEAYSNHKPKLLRKEWK